MRRGDIVSHKIYISTTYAILLLLTSCRSTTVRIPPFALETMDGRDEVIAYEKRVRRPVYQAKIPLAWKRGHQPDHESLLDTNKPIVTFLIDEEICLTVHNFPSQSIEHRIDPVDQVEHWATQLKGARWESKALSHDGFIGLSFKAICQNFSVWAWSLQLDAEHYQTLHFLAATVEEEEHYRQMGADVAIKVSGPIESLEKHREEISLFVNSFQLIQEIPIR